jgi:SH3-like domain-containing protein
MKKSNRLSAFLLALIMLFSATLTVFAETAEDTASVPEEPLTVLEEVQPTEMAEEKTEEPEADTEAAASPLPYATMAPMEKDQIPKPDPDARAEVIVIDPSGIALFELPAHESSVLVHLDAGSVLSLTTLGQTWSKVASAALEGYVPTYTLSFAYGTEQPAIILVTAPLGKLTLREEMTTRSKALAVIPSGRAALMLAKGDPFSLVRFEGREGYVLTEHLLEVQPNRSLGQYTQVISVDASREANVRLRGEASRNGPVYTSVKSGNFLVVLETNDGWAQVEYEGFHGFMMSDYLKSFE